MLVVAIIPASSGASTSRARAALGCGRHLRLPPPRRRPAGASRSSRSGAAAVSGGMRIPEVIDIGLLYHGTVLCAAGDHRHSLLIDPRDLFRIAEPRVADICGRDAQHRFCDSPPCRSGAAGCGTARLRASIGPVPAACSGRSRLERQAQARLARRDGRACDREGGDDGQEHERHHPLRAHDRDEAAAPSLSSMYPAAVIAPPTRRALALLLLSGSAPAPPPSPNRTVATGMTVTP